MPERKNSSDTRNLKSVLMVAHPGHEVRVHGWLEKARPIIFILTDGSGRVCQPRLQSTSAYFSANGWKRGNVTEWKIERLIKA